MIPALAPNSPKLRVLNRRIDSGKDWVPKIWDWIYVETHMYIDHGEDDVLGGLGEVIEVTIGKDTFVTVAEHSTHSYNWELLRPQQKSLRARFGQRVARTDPDLG